MMVTQNVLALHEIYVQLHKVMQLFSHCYGEILSHFVINGHSEF